MAANNIDWAAISQRLRRSNLTPIISNQMVNNPIFSGDGVISSWAEEVGYPFEGSRNLTRIAQYVLYEGATPFSDELSAKTRYSDHLKERLIEQKANANGTDPVYMEDLRSRSERLTFSQVATELRIPDFSNEPDHPLNRLASLPIPIYLTTCHHWFVESALKELGKTPHTAVYSWNEDLESTLDEDLKRIKPINVPGVVITDQAFIPSVKSPLVFHLHGIDDIPESLVLTEDDHLQFLDTLTDHLVFGQISKPKESEKPIGIPNVVRSALSSNQLILLGFDEQSLNLRVLLQGLKKVARRSHGYVIQVVPVDGIDSASIDRFERYLEHFFWKNQFQIYWGDPQDFMSTLWDKLEGGLTWNTNE